MVTMALVDVDLSAMNRLVEQEGGCIAWCSAGHLSPADDKFVRIERELDVDTEVQLIASVLSKKIAAGSTHVVIDIPVGPTAKVRSKESARHLAERMRAVAARSGLEARFLLPEDRQSKRLNFSH